MHSLQAGRLLALDLAAAACMRFKFSSDDSLSTGNGGLSFLNQCGLDGGDAAIGFAQPDGEWKTYDTASYLLT